MVKNGVIQAIKFVRDIIQTKRKPTSKDVENYVEMLKTFGLNDINMENIRDEIIQRIHEKIKYFQIKKNISKETEYKKVLALTNKFWEYFLEKKGTATG